MINTIKMMWRYPKFRSWNYQKEAFLDWVQWKFKNPYKLNMPGGNCPVQIEGFLETGEFYYFRARGTSWSLYICESEANWNNDVYIFQDRCVDYAPWPEAGWISKREALRLCTLSLKSYKLWPINVRRLMKCADDAKEEMLRANAQLREAFNL